MLDKPNFLGIFAASNDTRRYTDFLQESPLQHQMTHAKTNLKRVWNITNVLSISAAYNDTCGYTHFMEENHLQHQMTQ